MSDNPATVPPRPHRQHPKLDHCSGCIEEDAAGYNDGAFTFDDEKYPCCCRAAEESDD